MQDFIKNLAGIQRFDPTQRAAVSSARCNRAAQRKGNARLTRIILILKKPCEETVQTLLRI